jgi:hypothetical protein
VKHLLVPRFAVPDAASMVRIVEKDPVFQMANHTGELVYLQVQDCDGLTPLCTPEGKVKVVGEQLFHYDAMIAELRRQKWKTFVIVDSFRNSFARLMARPKIQRMVFVEELGAPGSSRLYYYGENYMQAAGRETSLYAVAKACVVVNAWMGELKRTVDLVMPFDDQEEAEVFADKLWKESDDMLLFVSGMKVPVRDFKKVAGRQYRMEHTSVIVSEFYTKADTFDDVADIIPYLTKDEDVAFFRNIETGESLYPDDVNLLMWYNVFYVKMGDPVFNLILSGEAGCAKTHALMVYAKLFGDDGSIIGEGGTQKGLIPSFSSDEPKVGVLASAKFFCGIDEFFQMPGDAAGSAGIRRDSTAYESYLRKLLPVITRQEKNYPSAKGNDFKVVMKASVMGTDNLKRHTRNALQTLMEDDIAVLRRFVTVFLTTETWKRVKEAPQANLDENMAALERLWIDKYGFDVKKMKRLAGWCRRVAKTVTVDGRRCFGAILDVFQDVFTEQLSKEGMLMPTQVSDGIKDMAMKVDYVPCMSALVRCKAVMRCVYAQSMAALPEINVQDEDYEGAKKVFKRILSDSAFLFGTVISQKMGAGGIMRTT